MEEEIFDKYDNVDIKKYKAIEKIIETLHLFAKNELSELEQLNDFYIEHRSLSERS